MDTDFAVAEECDLWDECGDYTNVYGGRVFEIEYPNPDEGYTKQSFLGSCADYPQLSRVFRDLDVRPLGEKGYLYASCP